MAANAYLCYSDRRPGRLQTPLILQQKEEKNISDLLPISFVNGVHAVWSAVSPNCNANKTVLCRTELALTPQRHGHIMGYLKQLSAVLQASSGI